MKIFYHTDNKVSIARNDLQELGIDAVIETANGCTIAHQQQHSWPTHSNVRQNLLPAYTHRDANGYLIYEDIEDEEEAYNW